jgi:hypothetical protein
LANGAAGPSPAAAPAWFGFHIEEKSRAAFPVARYAIDGGGGFVLDRGGPRPMLRFDDSAEIWLLRSARGPRGDEMFADDVGGAMLRINRFGGVTVFTPGRPEGSAAALQGVAAPLRPPRTAIGAPALYHRLVLASARASRAAGRLIAFEAIGADPASAAAIADAALVATQAVTRLASEPGGRRRLSPVARFAFTRSRSADVRFEGGVVQVAVSPEYGPGARPSSARILQTILEGDHRSPVR